MTTTLGRPADAPETEPGLPRWLRAAALADLDPDGHKTVTVGGQVLVLWRQDGQVYAVNNRCPHMGFPLDRGTCRDGILTCHWHAARFDLTHRRHFRPVRRRRPGLSRWRCAATRSG